MAPEAYWEYVEEGGLLLMDVYDNSDQPEVARAVMRFGASHFERIERIQGVRLSFVNSQKIVPTSLILLAFTKRS